MDVEEVSCGCIDDGPARLARRNIRRWKVRRGEYWKNGAEYVYGSVDRGPGIIGETRIRGIRGRMARNKKVIAI